MLVDSVSYVLDYLKSLKTLITEEEYRAKHFIFIFIRDFLFKIILKEARIRIKYFIESSGCN